MKFETYLENIAGVSIYPLVSLVLFVVFFGVVVYWMYRLPKTEIERIERLPLDDK